MKIDTCIVVDGRIVWHGEIEEPKDGLGKTFAVALEGRLVSLVVKDPHGERLFSTPTELRRLP